MIKVIKLLDGLDERLNMLASNKGQGIEDSRKLSILNNAIIQLVKDKVGLNNIYKLGIDAFKVRYQDLQKLVVQHTKLNLNKRISTLSSYSTPIPDNLFIPIHGYVIAERGECKERILNISQIVPHSDLMMFLNSPHHRPSFNYQETIAEISGDDFIVYNENKGEEVFLLKNLYLSYLRYPKKMTLTGLMDVDETIYTTTVDCELPEHLYDEILNIAAAQAAANTDNQLQFQLNSKPPQ